MDFFESIEETKKQAEATHDGEFFELLEKELREGLQLYWETASRILEGSGTRLLDPSEEYFSLKSNFFSALFLYSYHRAGIPGDHRAVYVAINQCLRGMVTGCDNILDNEYKKTLVTDLPQEGTRFRSVLDIMVSDRVLFDILAKAAERGAISRDAVLSASALSLHALLRSGVQEASEERGIASVLTPEKVLEDVHHYKTGLLFRAPWHIPGLFETVPGAIAESMMGALYNIGLGCQVMDDMVDLSNDVRKQRHNYVLSLLYHNVGEEARTFIASASSDAERDRSGNMLDAFPDVKTAASKKAISFLENGFTTLFETKHHFLIKPAILFLSMRVGQGIVELT